MLHDRSITISHGKSRKSTHWQQQKLKLSEMWEKLRHPSRSTETLNEYLQLSKAQQDELKDVGGYVGGELVGERRKANSVAGRDIITLDLDNIPDGGTNDVLRRLEGLGSGYCAYSTRKHHGAKPRLRVLIPLDRTVTADEYEPCARKLAQIIGLELADPSTFEASRLMYWPSCSADSDYVYTFQDKPFVSADGVLSQYTNWRDVTSWPAMPGAPAMRPHAIKQGDPETKSGVVGAFCRVYDVPRAIEELLQGLYEPVESDSNRYTFTGGTTAGGAVLYESGKFLFSHHATDPCAGKLVNAFDLVRTHRFSDLDDAAVDGTPINKMPSFKAMQQLAIELPEVRKLIAQERVEQAAQDFSGLDDVNDADTDETNSEWAQQLEISSTTTLPKPTRHNVSIILDHDPLLRGKFAINEFSGKCEISGALPWDANTKRRQWIDADDARLRCYLELTYDVTGSGIIEDAFIEHINKHAYHELQNYIKSLTWDGVPRLDRLYIDYLGAEDTHINTIIARKAMAAAVARGLNPGVKFDFMTVLSGPQGIGKSTLLRILSRGWFCDTIPTFEGKVASELIQGVWLVEIAELEAMRRADVSRVKQFLSIREDRFRAAYTTAVRDLPRTCVFFGTTNAHEVLQDSTGNRRFWLVDVGAIPAVKSVWKDLPGEVDQIWAEAKYRLEQGEALYLNADESDAANVKQEEHREASHLEGLVAEFVERPVPLDWDSWGMDKRRSYWAGAAVGDIATTKRRKVCALEIHIEMLGGTAATLDKTVRRQINDAVSRLSGWGRGCGVQRFNKELGVQRGFVRVEDKTDA